MTGHDTDHGITQVIRSAQSHWRRYQSYVDCLSISTASKNTNSVRWGCYDGTESEDCEILQSMFMYLPHIPILLSNCNKCLVQLVYKVGNQIYIKIYQIEKLIDGFRH